MSVLARDDVGLDDGLPDPGTPGSTALEHRALEHAALDRAALARAVLARAEERTGARRWTPRTVRTEQPVLGAADAGVRGDAPDGSAGSSAEPAGAPARERGVSARERGVEVEPEATARALPVPAHLAPLLPSGALDRGSTLTVLGSTSLVLGLSAQASAEGSWVAVVGLPQVGVLAAHQTGLELTRLALVPDPGPDSATVVAALLDGVDVVVVGPGVALDDVDRRRLAARARERSAVLLTTTPWPGAHVVLTAEESRWEGLGRGEGRLRGRRLVVRRTGRGTAAQARRLEVALPEPRAAVLGAGRAAPAGAVRTAAVPAAAVPAAAVPGTGRPTGAGRRRAG